MNEHLIRAVVEVAVFLEFTDEDHLDPDAAVQALEAMAYALSKASSAEKAALAEVIGQMSGDYKEPQAGFVASLPEALGLTED